VFVALTSLLKIDYRLSNVISIVAAVSLNFVLNRNYVFENTNIIVNSRNSKQFIKYIVLLLFNMIMSTVIVGSLISMGIKSYISKLISIIMIVSWTYFVYKTVIFKVKTENRESNG